MSTTALGGLALLKAAGMRPMCNTQPTHAQSGRFSKAQFIVDLDDASLICPAGRFADTEWGSASL